MLNLLSIGKSEKKKKKRHKKCLSIPLQEQAGINQHLAIIE